MAFITFEGIDGVGKSTMVRLLHQRLQEMSYGVVSTFEPGATDFGATIRRVVLHSREDLHPRAEILLYAADRAQHVEQVILPALSKGLIVLCDRYIDSSVAYQGYGLQQDPKMIRAINHHATGGCMPGLTLCLDAPLPVTRARKEGQDRVEKRSEDYFLRVREGYAQIAKEEPARFILLSAEGSIEEVFERVWSIVRKGVGR